MDTKIVKMLTDLATNSELKRVYKDNPEAVLELYGVTKQQESKNCSKLLLLEPTNGQDHKLLLLTPEA